MFFRTLSPELFSVGTFINDIGDDEIGERLNPECRYLGLHVGYCCAHLRNPDEAVDSEGGGEEPRHHLPSDGDIACRPRYSADEEQWDRHKHEHDDKRLAVMRH